MVCIGILDYSSLFGAAGTGRQHSPLWLCRMMQFPKSPLPQESQRVGHSYLEERYDPPLKSKYDVVTLTIAQDFKENSIFFNCLQTLQRFSNRCLHFESFPRIWLLSYEETKSSFHLIHLLLIWFNNQGETKEGNLGLNNGAFVITRAVALNDVLLISYYMIYFTGPTSDCGL